MPSFFCLGMPSAQEPGVPTKGRAKKLTALPGESKADAVVELLVSLGEGAGALGSAAALVERARAPISEALKQVAAPGDARGDVLAADIAAAFDACAGRLRECAGFAEEAKRLVAAAQTRNAAIKQALAAREGAWGPKLESDARAAKLNARFGRAYSAEERRERLQARHRANEEFRKRSDEAAEALSSFSREQPAIIGAVVAQVCRSHAAAFLGADDLGRSFVDLAARALEAGEAAAATAEALAPDGAAAAADDAASADDDEAVAEDEALSETTAETPGAEAAVTAAAASSDDDGDSAEAPEPELRPGASAAAAAAPSHSAGAAARPGRPAAPAAGLRSAPSPPAAGARPPMESETLEATPDAAVVTSTSASASPLRDIASEHGPEGQADGGFAQGAEVDIWSASREQWLAGVVEEVFEVDSVSDGYRVPAGVVKVAFGHGVRFVRPEDVATQLRLRGDDASGRTVAV